jgi:hypothetical protein
VKRWWILKALKFFAFAVVGVFLLGLIVMLLWNAVVPDVFRGPVLGYWQAVGLLLLSHLLLRGWSPWRHGNGWRRDRWRKRFEERLAAMTPEEREKFHAEWQHRCGPRTEGAN